MNKVGFVGATLLLLSALPASAGLIGQSVTVNYLYPDQSTVFKVLGSGVVTGGGFTVDSLGQHNLTVADAQITLQNVSGFSVIFNPGSFNGYEVIETGGSPMAFTGVTVDSATNVVGFTSSRVSFDATHVFLDMQRLTTDNQHKVVLDLQFGASSVPEPVSAGMVGVGLAVAGLLRRFKR